jgi:hypothetical protein
MNNIVTPGAQQLANPGVGGTARDGFLDSWRGIFQIVMLLDHMTFVYPGTFALLSVVYCFFGYVSVAEGFVFLSGFVSGLVYTRVGREKGNRAVWRKAIVRVRDIYLCYVLAVIALLALAKAIGRPPLEPDWQTDLAVLSLPVASAKVAALLYQPTILEILPMYCLFLLATPLILKRLEKGNYAEVALVSLSLWIGAQYGIRDVLLRLWPHRIETHFGYFNSCAWQILFVFGLICGHKTYTSKTHWLPAGWKLPAMAYICFVVLFAMRHNLIGINVHYRLVDRALMGPLRLFDFACIAYLVCSARGWMERLIGWRGFAFLSRHSLQVFAFHVFPLYLVAVLMGNRTSVPVWAQLLAVVFCIMSLFQIALLAKLFTSASLRFFGKRQVGSALPAR